MFLDLTIDFDTKIPSDFKGTRANIARAPPGARIDSSWRTIISRYPDDLCTSIGRSSFCRTAIARLEFVEIAV
jgi:hypothetical protein